jgi:RES domain
VIAFRHCDSRFPFLWSSSAQAPARWHGQSEGPANYFADTPVGAWAEFLRHEGITDVADLIGVQRSLWAIEIPDDGYEAPHLMDAVFKGGLDSYATCQAEAKRLRDLGSSRIEAPSAALISGGASGWVANPIINSSSTSRDGRVFVIFGPQSSLVGWPAVEAGSPPQRTLAVVHHL